MFRRQFHLFQRVQHFVPSTYVRSALCIPKNPFNIEHISTTFENEWRSKTDSKAKKRNQHTKYRSEMNKQTNAKHFATFYMHKDAIICTCAWIAFGLQRQISSVHDCLSFGSSLLVLFFYSFRIFRRSCYIFTLICQSVSQQTINWDENRKWSSC